MTTTETKSPIPPPPPPIKTTEDVSEDQVKKDESNTYTVVSQPLRKRTIMKVTLTSSEDDVYVKEWGARDLFGMIKKVQTLMSKLEPIGIFESTKEGETTGQRNAKVMQGIMTLLAESENDIEEIVIRSVYSDETCKKHVDSSFIDEVGIADLVSVLRGVWVVNWEHGGLKNALSGALA